MEDNVKVKTFTGVIWNYANQFGLQLIQLIPAMILARLLSPSEYGIIAISTIVTGLLSIFVEGGFPMALIQKAELKQIDISSVFYFNILISIVLYVLLFFTSPIIADFFGVQDLTNIIHISSLGLIIGALGSVQNTLLVKNLEFKKTTIINLTSCIISVVVGVCLAYMDYSYWALVIQSLTLMTIKSLGNWVMSNWRPKLCFSIYSLKEMFGYGSNVLIKQVTDYGFGKIYDVVIGKIYKPADLSYFNRANSTQALFADTFLMVLNSVTFPAFSKMQSDRERLRTNVLRFFLIEVMIISFIMLLVIALAEPIFHFMYSSKWDAVIPLFQLICIWGLFRPISVVFSNGLFSVGQSGICLRNSLLGRGFNILFLCITWSYGLKVMILGQVIAYLVEILLYTFSFNKEFGYSIRDLLKDVVPYYVVSGGACLIVFGIDRALVSNITIENEMLDSFIRLIIDLSLGTIIYLTMHRKLKMKAYIDFATVATDVTKSIPGINIITRLL